MVEDVGLFTRLSPHPGRDIPKKLIDDCPYDHHASIRSTLKIQEYIF
jgi:hypothetical protein